MEGQIVVKGNPAKGHSFYLYSSNSHIIVNLLELNVGP